MWHFHNTLVYFSNMLLDYFELSEGESHSLSESKPFPALSCLQLSLSFPTLDIWRDALKSQLQRRSNPRRSSPSVTSCQLRVNTLHKFHSWWLVIAETSGFTFLLFPKLSSTMIPSIAVGLLSPLSHMPLQKGPEDVCRGQPARPSQAYPVSKIKVKQLPPEHLPLSHSSSFAASGPGFALHSFLAPKTVLQKAHPIIWDSILVPF